MFREALAIFRLFNMMRRDLYDLGIVSNGHIMTRELQTWAGIMPLRISQAVGKAAHEFMSDCIVEIDNLIYSQPGSPTYHRTRDLRKAHRVEKLSEGVYLIENTMPYAIFQHDGWTDRSGAFHPGRPWMDVAMTKNEKKYEQIMDVSVGGIFG